MVGRERSDTSNSAQFYTADGSENISDASDKEEDFLTVDSSLTDSASEEEDVAEAILLQDEPPIDDASGIPVSKYLRQYSIDLLGSKYTSTPTSSFMEIRVSRDYS
jgi:hypothetical protein